jgi:ATP-dependent phosphoenolpyruvate carboxykinase
LRNDPHVGVVVPLAVGGIDSDFLDPVKTWSDNTLMRVKRSHGMLSHAAAP